MQNLELKAVAERLKTFFPQVEIVERKEDGMQDSTSYAYLRPDNEEGNEFRREGDWIIGTYAAVAESDDCDLLAKLWGFIEKAGGEVREGSAIAETIYLEETSLKLTRRCNIARVIFTLCTDATCIGC